ncbi:hypothetical protein Q5752_006856 [Cryptotrichosporon argae]
MPASFPPVAFITDAGPSRLREWRAEDLVDAELEAPRPAGQAPPSRRGLAWRPGLGARHAHAPAAPLPQETFADLVGWHTNASGHGRGPRGLPAFVPAQSTYDELGRVVEDAVGVEVLSGLPEAGGEDKLDGEELGAWYAAMAERVRVAAQREQGRVVIASAARATEAAKRKGKERQAVSLPAGADVIELIDSDSDDGLTASTSSAPHAAGAPAGGAARSVIPLPTPAQAQDSLRVHSREWFIRRALLSAHRARLPSEPTPVARPRPAPPAPSISALLDIPPSSTRPPPRPAYAIRPDNPGYIRLRELGWTGGGLGRPDGWVGPPLPVPARKPESEPARVKDEGGPAHVAVPHDVAVDENGIVDLTLDSDGFSDASDASNASDVSDDDDAAPAGPGRTAPLLTRLKLDRLGLGHRRAGAKRVTHTHAQVEAARRRARGVASTQGAGDRESRGEEGKAKRKRGERRDKVKWAVRDRRDRDERARIARALNA